MISRLAVSLLGVYTVAANDDKRCLKNAITDLSEKAFEACTYYTDAMAKAECDRQLDICNQNLQKCGGGGGGGGGAGKSPVAVKHSGKWFMGTTDSDGSGLDTLKDEVRAFFPDLDDGHELVFTYVPHRSTVSDEGMGMPVNSEKDLFTALMFAANESGRILRMDAIRVTDTPTPAPSMVPTMNPTGKYTSCAEAKAEGKGTGIVEFHVEGKTIDVFCEMDHGAPWTMIAANGESKGGNCHPHISPNAAGCGTLTANLKQDYNSPGWWQKTLKFKQIMIVVYEPQRGYTAESKYAFTAMKWEQAAALSTMRFGATAFTPENVKVTQIKCQGGTLTHFTDDTGHANPDKKLTKFCGKQTGGGSSFSDCMSFREHDKSGTPYQGKHGWDDYQDGSGCGDNWSPKSVSGYPGAVFVR